ncbi:MAG: alpha/beta hydrolase [Candidatus Marinimicrobia bacterium]|nr:alpha/beta hydrolase [Candidatus Neomarinimicrobiota bacterium]
MKRAIFILITLVFANLFGQIEKHVTLQTETGKLRGTLLLPETRIKVPVALIIAGSGPTDRNGNQPGMQNNSLKLLAKGLAKQGIASLRYDKRGVGKSKNVVVDENKLRFEHYIEDAIQWIELLNKNKKFNDIIVIGHSQGSLIGMQASRIEIVDKYISIAGHAAPASELIKKQLKSQPQLYEQSLPIINKLKQEKTVQEVPQKLYSIFRPSVQPFLISWFKYDPIQEIAKLEKPIMIVQGTTDIQIEVNNANLLAMANPNAQKLIIKNMNHIMKKSSKDLQKNIATYNQPDLPLVNGVVDSLAQFIKE